MKPINKITLLLILLWPIITVAHDFEVDGIYYNSSYGNKAIVTYRGTSYNAYTNEYSGDVTIPSTVSYDGMTYSVTSIGYNAFNGCTKLASIDIPNTVTQIDWDAFENCSGLTSVNIPNTVTLIGNYAFKGCTGLTDVTIPNSVTTIGGDAFYGCTGLRSITIPKSVTRIGGYAFGGCSNLTSLHYNAISCSDFSSSSPFYNLNITNIDIGNEVERIPAYFGYLLEKLTNIIIPNNVHSIGESAFSQCI